MRRGLLYAIYSGITLLGAGYAQWRGISLFNNVAVVNNVPRSVRDNPGSYRSMYTFLPRYSGGK